MDDEILTECVVCGGHINAGSWPPVCCRNCRFEYDLECEFNKFARQDLARYREEKKAAGAENQPAAGAQCQV